MSPVAVSDNRRLWRSRWAAIGAAVAVTLGGGGIFVANAASSEPSSVVTIDPVRVLDTRDPVNVGLPGPFVSATSKKLLVTGSIVTTTGTKTVVPAGATGVLLNVTPVGSTADGFISIRPGDATGAPTTSSLNFTAGEVLPNSVQVGLPTAGADAGQIDITYDAYGVPGPTTDVLIDVVGYTVAADAATPSVLEIGLTDDCGINKDTTIACSLVRIASPAAGRILVTASGSAEHLLGTGDLTCSITTGNSIGDPHMEIANIGVSVDPFSQTRGFVAVAGASYDFSLLCNESVSNVTLQSVQMTALFIAD